MLNIEDLTEPLLRHAHCQKRSDLKLNYIQDKGDKYLHHNHSLIIAFLYKYNCSDCLHVLSMKDHPPNSMVRDFTLII